MDDHIREYKARRDERVKKRLDDDWITIKGTHVMVDDEGKVTVGPKELKKAAKGRIIKGAPMFNASRDTNSARRREMGQESGKKWDKRAFKKYMGERKASEPDKEREEMKKGLRDEVKKAEGAISQEQMADFMDWPEYYKQKEKIEGAKRELAELEEEEGKRNPYKGKPLEYEPYNGPRSGDKKLDNQFEREERARFEWKRAQEEEKDELRRAAKRLGIRKRADRRYSFTEEEMKKIREAKDPELIAAEKATEKAMNKHIKETHKLSDLYTAYKKNGGRSIMNYYRAAHEWDDED